MTRAPPIQDLFPRLDLKGNKDKQGLKVNQGTAGPTRTAVVTERAGDASTITPGAFGFPEASCNSGEISYRRGIQIYTFRCRSNPALYFWF